MSKQSTDCKEAGRLHSPDSTFIRWVKQLSEDLFAMLIAGLWDNEYFSLPADCNKFGVSGSSESLTAVFLILVWCYSISTGRQLPWFQMIRMSCPTGTASAHRWQQNTLVWLTLKMKALYTYKMSVTVCHLTQHNIPEDLDLLQHCSENLKSHKQHSTLGLVLKRLIIVSGCIMQLKFYNLPIGYVPRPDCAM